MFNYVPDLIVGCNTIRGYTIRGFVRSLGVIRRATDVLEKKCLLAWHPTHSIETYFELFLLRWDSRQCGSEGVQS